MLIQLNQNETVNSIFLNILKQICGLLRTKTAYVSAILLFMEEEVLPYFFNLNLTDQII